MNRYLIVLQLVMTFSDFLVKVSLSLDFSVLVYYTSNTDQQF
jgi:hypothetical protein